MRKFILVFILFLLGFLLGVFYLAYSRGGKYYSEAKSIIERTPKDKKAHAQAIFAPEGDYLYSGIYMGSVESFVSGVWVWGEKGPKFFLSDEHTVYSLYKMCTQEILNNLESGQPISPMRGIYKEISEWKEMLFPGYFIVIRITEPKNGGREGNLREANAYDWWLFDNGGKTIEQLCDI